jgi:hypothetical protein
MYQEAAKPGRDVAQSGRAQRSGNYDWFFVFTVIPAG